MVRKERLELSRLAALEPKSSAYTNFATSAEPVHSTKKLELQLTTPHNQLIVEVLECTRVVDEDRHKGEDSATKNAPVQPLKAGVLPAAKPVAARVLSPGLPGQAHLANDGVVAK